MPSPPYPGPKGYGTGRSEADRLPDGLSARRRGRRRPNELGLTLDLTDFTDAQAVAAVGRITRGNFRLVHRLFVEIERVLKINDLTVITSDVVEAARSTLVIGDT